MNSFLQIIAFLLAGPGVLMSLPVLIRLQQPTSPAWWGLKVFACALAPFLAMAGALSMIPGILTGSFWIVLPGAYAAIFFLIYLYRVKVSMEASSGFRGAFGTDWERNITVGQKNKFLPKANSLGLPAVPESGFILEQDISYCTIPGTTRRLLCDVWQPAKHITASGLAFIYFHGSAWCVLDKDFGTRPFFRHLTAQGHVVMDVAYRLFPETGMAGMVHDVYRAIAWMKSNATAYGVNPDCIVAAGGSAGGHLALLAAYNSNNPKFIPMELQGKDLAVGAVISVYGPTDLQALYYHTGQHITTREKSTKNKSAKIPPWIRKVMGKNFHRLGFDKGSEFGILPEILGCHPDECPERYAFFSPMTYVHKDCPATLIIQGEHDLIVPVNAVRSFYNRLTENGVPAVMFVIPQTDHAFDLVLPKMSPVAHTVFYAVERFLALLVNDVNRIERQKANHEIAMELLKNKNITNETAIYNSGIL